MGIFFLRFFPILNILSAQNQHVNMVGVQNLSSVCAIWKTCQFYRNRSSRAKLNQVGVGMTMLCL